MKKKPAVLECLQLLEERLLEEFSVFERVFRFFGLGSAAGEAAECYARAQRLLANWNPQEAVKAAARAVELMPRQPEYQFLLATISLFNRDLPTALAAVETAIQLAPQEFDFHFLKGDVLFEMHRFPEAVAVFEKACKLGPDNPEIHARLGKVYVRVGRRADAQKELDYLQLVDRTRAAELEALLQPNPRS